MLSSKRGLALIVTHVDPTSGVGGAEKFVKTLMEVYNSCNLLPVLVITSRNARYHITKIDSGYISVVPSIAVGFVSLIPLSLRALRRILYLLKNTAILHVVYCETPIELLITLIAKLIGRKIVASPLAFISWLFHHNKLVRIFAFLIVGIKFIITRIADIMHVASLYDKRYVERVNKNVYLIPHGIEPPPEHVVCPEEYKQKYRGKFVIGFVGRFTETKGAIILLEALYQLIAKHRINAHLLIIGPKHIALRTLLKYAKGNPTKYVAICNNITITGRVDERKKYELLKCCNVGVILSLSDPIEAFSYALSEYNYVGVPVVGHIVGSLKTRLLPCAGKRLEHCNSINLLKELTFLANASNVNICKLRDVITSTDEKLYFKIILRKIFNLST